MKEKPDFIIVGAMKCATSTLQKQLSLQPGIFMTTPKEPNFFSDDDIYKNGINWYKALFKSASDLALCGEASTHYTKLPTYDMTIQRMINNKLNPLKIIYIIRNPIDRLISHYIHEWTQNKISTDINNAVHKHPELVEYSKYFMQIQPYIESFGTENVLIMFYERLIRNPQLELERACQFIGYKGDPKWVDSESLQNVSSERIRKFPGYSLVVENSFMSFLRRKFIPKSLRNRIKSKLTKSKRPTLNQATLISINIELDKDLNKLSNLLGIPLNTKHFDQQACAHD